jgi:hypothetical protein
MSTPIMTVTENCGEAAFDRGDGTGGSLGDESGDFGDGEGHCDDCIAVLLEVGVLVSTERWR